MKLVEVLEKAKQAGFKGVDDGVEVWSIDCFWDVAEICEEEYSTAYDLQRTSYNRVRIDSIGRDGYRRPTTWWLVR